MYTTATWRQNNTKGSEEAEAEEEAAEDLAVENAPVKELEADTTTHSKLCIRQAQVTPNCEREAAVVTAP